jgi:hypothetical protein
LQVGAFAADLSNFGVFDALASGGMIKAPLSSTVGAITTLAQGFVVGEGSAKQVSKLSLTISLEPRKAQRRGCAHQ